MPRLEISNEKKKDGTCFDLLDVDQINDIEVALEENYDSRLEDSSYQSQFLDDGRESIIGGALVRKSMKCVDVESDDYCDCGMRAFLSSKITDNSTTYMFNHFIADFSKYKLTVSDECNDGKGCMVLKYLQKRMSKQLDGFDFTFHSVNIEALQDIATTFNHASCQCMFPKYKVNEYVALSNYPFLDHIHVGFARERINPDNSFVFSAYAGIVAF